MKKLLVVLLVVFVSACSDEDNPLNNLVDDVLQSKITAKEELAKVEVKAQTEFSSDAKLAAIFARNIGLDGEIDLLKFSKLNGFIYAMQSAEQEDNRFYLPVYLAGPRELPLTLNDLLVHINDEDAKNTIAAALGLLATVNISSEAQYLDSDDAMELFLAHGGQTFVNVEADASVDLFLFPSKSINANGLENSADWIAHFYTSSKSLVLWLNSGTSIVTEL